MATEVIMPKVDMVMDNGTFVEWLKQEGDHVEKGEPLFVILTDKANIEIEAPASGILAGVRAQPDDVIPVTEVIAYILEPGESLLAETEARPPTIVPAEVPTSAPSVPELMATEAARPGPGEGKVRATPVARRLAAELGIDLTKVPGGGPRGRIHKADVLAFAERQPPAVVQPGVAAAPFAPVPHVPMPDARRKEAVTLAGPRKIIADRMAYSAFTAPHITLSLWVDMSEAARLRTRLLEPLRAKTGQRLSFTAILARAVATVLPRHPYLNASLHGEEILLWDDVHLGVATSVEDYLIVPVIREAQAKNLEEIVAVLGDLVERARARRLAPAEMTGSTFTISNLGMFGIESFTAIVNPPESAILAVGRIVDTPVGAEGEIVLRPMMNLTICTDHRVVDGAGAARFLAELKATLENPYLLI
ncbi:MAG: 2-oxo acid dehydrogenase subunit E2 [Anaerolineales bacterium]|nr:MAG: 2-oxo acid dehydrogenase subunit E2 [Anaerolineales bacterium]